MAKNAMGHGSAIRGGPTIKSHHKGIKHASKPAAHQSGMLSLKRNRKAAVKGLDRVFRRKVS